MAKACQLFSGSSGNSIFISNAETKILVDAGVSAKRIEEGLAAIGEDASSLSAIFITHEHFDHISGLRVLASRHRIPVFAEESVMERLYQDGRVNEKIPTEILDGNAEIGGVEIIPFELSHDSASCTGYRFNLPSGKSVSVCTDTGYITPAAESTLIGSDLVYLESNHEITILQNGGYPYMLKKRILSEHGHLSNAACAEFAEKLVKNGTTRLVLAHLSRENNTSDIARQTTLSSLVTAGFEEERDFRLKVSAPINSERPIIL